jgi:hypothetical protein
MISVLYEHPEWFEPLFAELRRRGLPYALVRADQLCYDPASAEAPCELVFNRMSPSAYLRGHARAIFTARHYLQYLEHLGVASINGSRAYDLELSKARQLALMSTLGVLAPKTRVVNKPEQILLAADNLEFPLIVKPNIGGSGALMRRFEAPDDLHEAHRGEGLNELLGIDGTALVQEYHPPHDGAIVRVEVLDSQFLYAIRIENDPEQGFNLCPADICQVSEEAEPFDLCPADAPAKPARKIEAYSPPQWIRDAVIRVCHAGGLDLGGVEYLESERDGRIYFYDINALSNFVTDAPNLVGFDPFVLLGEFVERRYAAARKTQLATAAG